MPTRAPSICAWPGCTKIGQGRHCAAHTMQREEQRKDKDRRRGSAHSRGYGARWRAARLGYLRTHPLCKACMDEGKVTSASVVDHVTPHDGDMRLFWDSSNWQALCKPCHDAKTAREDGGFGNTATSRGRAG